MSIKFIDENIFDIYIKKDGLGNVDFNNKDNIEKYLKKLFRILKNKYFVKIEGFYNITIYIDKYYGVIFHLEKEELEYYDYFKNQVDMRIISIDTEFLYLVDDIPNELSNKIKICIINNNIYLKIKKELSNLEMMNLIENSKIIYDYN